MTEQISYLARIGMQVERSTSIAREVPLELSGPRVPVFVGGQHIPPNDRNLI